MECKYYRRGEDKCAAGMTVVRIFADLVCTDSLGKCPIFIDIYGLAGNRALAA